MKLTTLRQDLFAGAVVALVSAPQCMGFAVIAGLDPSAGLYAAMAMGLAAMLAATASLDPGPAVTTSTMTYAVIASIRPESQEQWAALAGHLAVLVGLFTILAAVLRVAQFIRYVSRSVLVGFTAGAALIVCGAQLAPLLGLSSGSSTTLIGVLWTTLVRLPETSFIALSIGAGVIAVMTLGARVSKRFPVPFVALALAGVVAWWLDQRGLAAAAPRFPTISPHLPRSMTPGYAGAYDADLLVGAAAISLVSIIQTLAIARALATRELTPRQRGRDLISLGLANVASGLFHGFPGAASFNRSALKHNAGAQTWAASLVTVIVLFLLITYAAPLTHYIPQSAIAGLLIATSLSAVQWDELTHLVRFERDERIALAAATLGVLVLPIHWAFLIGMGLSTALFVRRAARLHLSELVGGPDGPFLERRLDHRTGESPITILQAEGPLFFAHADQIASAMRRVFARRPRVVILRMRRTQQIDFSVISAMEDVVAEYVAAGGAFIVCGLTRPMRSVLRNSGLGKVITPQRLLRTRPGEIFGSARRAVKMAVQIAGSETSGKPLFRAVAAPLRGPADLR